MSSFGADSGRTTSAGWRSNVRQHASWPRAVGELADHPQHLLVTEVHAVVRADGDHRAVGGRVVRGEVGDDPHQRSTASRAAGDEHDDGLHRRPAGARRPRAAAASGPTTANGPSPRPAVPATVAGKGHPVRDRAGLLGRRRRAARGRASPRAGRRTRLPASRLDVASSAWASARPKDPIAETPQACEVAHNPRARPRGRPRATGCRCRSRTRPAASRVGYSPGVNPSTSIRSMCTGRGARSTSSPSRASSWRRRPSTLIADTIGGTWSMSPTNADAARSTCSRESPASAADRGPHPPRRACSWRRRTRPRPGTPCPLPGGSAGAACSARARRAARRSRRDRACRRGRRAVARRPRATSPRCRATSSPAGLSTTTRPSTVRSERGRRVRGAGSLKVRPGCGRRRRGWRAPT